jgi:hypothetical protein
MTKDQYFEMCEMMGTDVFEEEIPVELNDFPAEVQTAFEVYQVLQDHWEAMSGTYMGKNLTGVKDILDIYEVEHTDRKLILELINLIDRERMIQYDAKRKQEDSLKSSKSPP